MYILAVPDLRVMNLLRVKIFIAFLFYINATFSHKIEIGRYITNIRKGWKYVKDVFNIPDSECEQNGGTETGTGNLSYYCSCPDANSTLTYYNKEWRCRENAEVRKQLGCIRNNLFLNENIKHKLRTLKTKEARRTKLTKDCAVNFALSWYIGCRGEREKLPTDARFEIIGVKNQTKFNLKVTDDSFQGRIINLGISCKSGRFKNSCLLFKVEGNLTCPIMKPNMGGFSSTIAPITTSSYSIATTTPTSPSKAFSEASTQRKKAPSQNPSQPTSGIRQMGNDDSPPSLGITIGVTLSTAIVILFIATVVCYRRRKSRKDAHTPTAHQMKANILGASSKRNAAFKPEDQNDCFNTSNDETGNSHSVELYASLNVPEGHNIYGHRNAQDPDYNDVQDPCPGNEEEGQYSVYEELSGTIPGRAESINPNRVEPDYNTLEDPCQDGSERSEYCGTVSVNEPFYNTLEESNANEGSQSTNEEPVHNTLEEPNLSFAGENGSFESTSLQDPVYNVLEGPASFDVDSNIPMYAAVNKENSSEEKHCSQ